MKEFIPKIYKKENITVRIAADKLARVDALAAKFNLSRSEFVNQCIDFAVENMPPVHKK